MPVRPLPTTADVLASAVLGKVDGRTDLPRNIDLLPEGLIVNVIIASTLFALGPLTLVMLRL